MYYADVKSKTVSYVKKYFCDTSTKNYNPPK